MARIAEPRDREPIESLWQEAFGDTPEEIGRFFDTFPDCLSYVTEDCAAMVHALPMTLSPDLPAAYLYAVATRADRQGQGLCRRLMAHAEQDLAKRGFACCILAPGAPSLFAFYEKLGYTTAFTGSTPPCAGGTPISPAEYLRLRETLLQNRPHLLCDDRLLRYVRALYGLTLYRTADGIAAVSDGFTAECLPEGLTDDPCAMIKWLDHPRPLTGG